MIYKFKSKASGDVIMLGPNGDQMLRIIGREPAPKGIVEVEHMAAAIAALRAAVRDAEAPAEAAAASRPGPPSVPTTKGGAHADRPELGLEIGLLRWGRFLLLLLLLLL